MARLIRAYDWSSTTLGPISSWPQSLTTITAFLVDSPLPIVLLWGPDGVMLYNDAYVAISERTEFIGRRFRDVFANITGQGFHELFEGVFRSGEGVVTRGMALRLHGREETQSPGDRLSTQSQRT